MGVTANDGPLHSYRHEPRRVRRDARRDAGSEHTLCENTMLSEAS